jgi:HK97 family phage major capsid protein
MKTFAQIQEAKRARRALFDQACAISTAAEKENRKLTAEENTKMDRMLDDVEVMGKEIERDERALGLGADLQEAKDMLADARAQQGIKTNDNTEKHSAAFKRFLQVGLTGLNVEDRSLIEQTYKPMEGRDLSTGAGNAGGFLVPEGFVAALEKALKWYGPMLSVADIISTDSGAPLPWPTVNDTGSSGELLGEGSAASGDATTPFGEKSFGAYIFSSKVVPVSIALLQDSAFDEGIIVDLLAERIGRALNTYLTTGTGSSQPAGVVTGSTSGKVGTAGQTLSVIYDDLVDLKHSVDVAYRNSPKAAWMMNDLTVAALTKIKDTTGRPIWAPSIVPDKPDTILGKPVHINNDMAVMAANAKSILFGDMSKFKVRRVRDVQIMRLAERYAEKLQVGFLGFVRADSAVLNGGTNPIKYYANSAT